jgi:hypothetical protein
MSHLHCHRGGLICVIVSSGVQGLVLDTDCTDYTDLRSILNFW